MKLIWTMCLAVIAGMLLSSGASLAGSNAGGTARLSWDEFVAVTNLDALPANPAPLYLLLSGAPDVRALAVDFRWSPNDQFGPGYHVETMPEQPAGYGVANATNPGGDFDGDTTYTWSIVFPEGYSEHSCVLYSVGRMSGDTASFCLISVKTKDSNGNVDDLEITGNAMIFGGVPGGCPIEVESIFPHTAVAGTANTFEIHGANLPEDATVTLVNDRAQVTAESVTLTNPSTMTASVDVPGSFSGPIQLIVTSGTNGDTLWNQMNAPSFANPYRQQEILVWFKPTIVGLPSGLTSCSVSGASYALSEVEQLLESAGVTELSMLTPTATAENLAGLDAGQLDIYVCALSDTNVIAAITTLQADSAHVRVAEPNWRCQAGTIPSDSRFSEQWWLRNTGQYGGAVGKDVQATIAWDRTTGGTPSNGAVDIVVLDTGVDAGHPDLLGRVVAGPNYIYPGLPPDDDAPRSHGTSVAGIIAAQGNGGGSVAGMDWSANIVAVKVLDSDGYGFLGDILAAVDWARTSSYKLLNVSIYSYNFSTVAKAVYRNAWAAGMAVFAISGNENCLCTTYPAAYSPLVIPTGAMDDFGLRWDDHNTWGPGHRLPGDPPDIDGDGIGDYLGSNWGSYLRFVAPGGLLIQTTRSRSTGSYYTVGLSNSTLGFGGTSAAAPIVAGAAGLLYSLAMPLSGVQLTGEDFSEILSRTAVPMGPPGWDAETGWGGINADDATAFISGQNRVEHGSGGSIADYSLIYERDISVIDYPGIPDGHYRAYRHAVRGTATLTTPFIASPTMWMRQASSMGAGFIPNPLSSSATVGWTPSTWIASQTGSQATFETYIYNLQPIGGGQQAWWPTTIPGAQFGYTAVGPISLLAVDMSGFGGSLSLTCSPNPAVLLSTMELRLPSAGPATLDIFDLHGRRVQRLTSGIHTAGSHQLRWNLTDQGGRRVGPGMYLAQATTAAGTRTVKVVVTT